MDYVDEINAKLIDFDDLGYKNSLSAGLESASLNTSLYIYRLKCYL